MEYIVVCLVAFIVSGLTLFSGFGLGTLLMPAFALFFPIPVARHQGALRSAFLIKAGLSKEVFIGTGVAAAVIVDIARLAVYGVTFYSQKFTPLKETWVLVLLATLSAFIGALLGRKLLKKITLQAVQVLVGVMLILLGLAMGTGLI